MLWGRSLIGSERLLVAKNQFETHDRFSVKIFEKKPLKNENLRNRSRLWRASCLPRNNYLVRCFDGMCMYCYRKFLNNLSHIGNICQGVLEHKIFSLETSEFLFCQNGTPRLVMCVTPLSKKLCWETSVKPLIPDL